VENPKQSKLIYQILRGMQFKSFLLPKTQLRPVSPPSLPSPPNTGKGEYPGQKPTGKKKKKDQKLKKNIK
jgi:hypothetical protein